MEQSVRLAGLDARILKHIRNTARRVAKAGSIPGMDRDDIEQDLILDLLRRRDAYDPTRASFRTFADRVVAHRVASLTVPTARLRAERATVSLDAPIGMDGDVTIGETIVAHGFGSEHDIGLTIDVRQFVAGLSPALRRCCAILLAPNLSESIRDQMAS